MAIVTDIGVLELEEIVNGTDDDEQYVHIESKSDPNMAVCGFTKRHHVGHDWVAEGLLCSCGAPVCPTCRSVADLWKRTGYYEGA
jgi:hypothetical protein